MICTPPTIDGNSPSRQVHAEDALPWLKRHAPLSGCSLVTSLPDVSGLAVSGSPAQALEQWRTWFIDAAALVMTATVDQGATVFYQTDIKREGTWVDKSYLCHLAAERAGSALLWHKIVCRAPAGQVGFGRPQYTHLLCYSRGVRDRVAQSYADVLPSTGRMTWSQAMGVDACEFACRYVLSHTSTRTIVDPFCGVGTVLAVANRLGMNAIGVELSRRRAGKARRLQV